MAFNSGSLPCTLVIESRKSVSGNERWERGDRAVGGHLDLHSLLFGCDEEEEGHESDLRARYCSFSPSVFLPSLCGCLGNFWFKN